MKAEILESNVMNQHDDTTQKRYPNDLFIGHSLIFQSIIETINRIAEFNCPVIISGETGTGKEITAHQIHARSSRQKGPFVPVDCTTITGQLFESQLFGHVKGAFTGAVSDSLGFFRAAANGTIFLDEIGELSQELQPKLLRVLQESCVVPVGSAQPHKIDVRVICATNRDLQEMVREGTFRDDLYYRLDVIQLKIPPLRARREDVIPLVNYFLDRQADLYNQGRKKLSEPSAHLLEQYHWPGNVRELANVVERAYIISRSDLIEPEALRINVLPEGTCPEQTPSILSLDEIDKEQIIRALQISNGRIMETARLLKISYGKLRRLIDKYHIRSTYH